MNTAQPVQSLTLATIWFALGFAVAAAAIYALFGKAPFLAPALLTMSVLLFMLSAQRTERFAIEQVKFRKRMQFVAFTTTILSSLSIVFNSSAQ